MVWDKPNTFFIKNSESSAGFKLDSKDVTNTIYKKAVQHLISKHLFNEFLIEFKDISVNADSLNKAVNTLKRKNPNGFARLYKFPITGTGPGELLLYFLFDDAKLGGGTSAGKDITIGNISYEIKAAALSGDKKIIKDVRLGTTENLNVSDNSLESKLVDRLKKLCAKTNIILSQGTGTIDKLRNLTGENKIEFNEIEKDYQQLVAKYFKHTVIFFNNNATTKMGEVVAVKTVQPQDIQLHRYTQNRLRPSILI